jgi:hypothetical protein
MTNAWLKVKYSFISALVFYIVANPETYKLTQWLLGSLFQTAYPMGAATSLGLLLHTFVFFAVMWGLMMLPAGTL